MFTRISILVAVVLLGMSSAWAQRIDPATIIPDPAAAKAHALQLVDDGSKHNAILLREEALYCRTTACHEAYALALKSSMQVIRTGLGQDLAEMDSNRQLMVVRHADWSRAKALLDIRFKALKKYEPKETVGSGSR